MNKSSFIKDSTFKHYTINAIIKFIYPPSRLNQYMLYLFKIIWSESLDNTKSFINSIIPAFDFSICVY